MDQIIGFAPFILIIIAFYFLLIRPQRNRQKKQQEMVLALQPGAEVMTTAGIFGTVAAVTDDQLSLEISPGVHIRILPAAVAKVIEQAPAVSEPTAPETDQP